jgi:hypothetical protein|tara:strand:- start:89 stop:2470 length:2382 start_codon:yes stop_codon:yes gene_type:complete
MEITIFKDIKDTSQPFYRNVNMVLERIEQGNSKEIVKKIRSTKNKEERNELKKQLPAICFSGKFTKRNDASLTEHSGLICLDFDGYNTSKDLLQEKEKITKDKYVFSVFISPSGKGLKVLVKIPKGVDNHKNYFSSLNTYFNSPYFDTTSKNISRVCYESYDPLIHINSSSSLWEKIDEVEFVEVNKYKDRPTIPVTDENKIVDILLKWWENKYGLKNGERNNNVFILASAFNDFGVPKNLAEFIMGNFDSKDFNIAEIRRTINSAYTHVQNFGTKYYEDHDRVSLVKQQLRRGVSKKEIRCQLESEKIDVGDIDNVIIRIEEEQTNHKFWTKNDKGVIKIVHILFKNYLEDNGFYKFSPEGTMSYIFVRVTNNLIDHASEKEIKDFVLSYLLTTDDLSVYNYFAEHTKYFREDFLTLIASINVFFIADTKDVSYLYYINCAVKITKNDIILIDYLDLGGYVWRDHVIDRIFTLCQVRDCNYKTFISNISGEDDSRIISMQSTIGYLLHGWKNLSYCPAVILNDEIISENPEGGTGKGLFINALAKMKKCVTIDGKSFSFEKSFAYQLVSTDTQIICFDDVKKSFDFEKLFSVITEGLTIEKKNKDSLKIPFEKSPKVALTTNYALKGKGSSFERRKWDLELAQFYTKDFTPLVEFGQLMFGEWDDNEWCQFDNYMMSNLQLYLDKGLIKGNFVNKKIKDLSGETSHEFIEWCGLVGNSQPNDKLKPNQRVYKTELYDDFVEEYPDNAPKSKFTVARRTFYSWIKAYSLYKFDVELTENKDLGGRYFIFGSND